MRVLFNTNVLLDVLLAREPFAALSANLVARVERRELGGLLCATTVTTIHYLATRQIGKSRARQAIADLLVTFEVAPVDRSVLEEAVRTAFTDFEHAVLNHAAQHAGAEAIVTRDAGDFRPSTLKIYSPEELVLELERQKR